VIAEGIGPTGLDLLDENWSNVVTTPPFILTIFYNSLAEEAARLQKR